MGTRGRGPWVDGNNIDFVFLSPNASPLERENFTEVEPQATEKSQNSFRWCYTTREDGSKLDQDDSAPVAIAAMKQILKRYPPKDVKTVRVPWQPNPGFAAYYASFDDRRVVVVPTVDGKADSPTIESLESPDVLKKHFTNYVFLKLAPSQAPPELQKAMEKAGPAGLVILERPESGDKKSPLGGAKVLAASAGPHSPASIKTLLDKFERPPGWEQQISVPE